MKVVPSLKKVPSTPTKPGAVACRRASGPPRQAGGGCYDAPVSGEPHIRKVRPDDLEEIWRVRVASSNDLLVRRGRPAARPADAPVASDARAGLASDPDGYAGLLEGVAAAARIAMIRAETSR
jgi:hypothetical protein